MKQQNLTPNKKLLKKAFRCISVTLEKLENKNPSPPNSLKSNGLTGLPALKQHEEYKKACMDYFIEHTTWVELIETTKDAITNKSSIVSKAIGHTHVIQLMEAINKQKKTRGGAFGEDLASLKFLETVIASLCYLEKIKETPKSVKQPTRKTWNKAIDAVNALIQTSHQGVPIELASIQADIADLNIHKIKKLKTALMGIANKAPKPHSDSHAIYRAACKYFVQCLYVTFDRKVPPSLVKKFCGIIGYNPEKVIRRYIKIWTQELDYYVK